MGCPTGRCTPLLTGEGGQLELLAQVSKGRQTHGICNTFLLYTHTGKLPLMRFIVTPGLHVCGMWQLPIHASPPQREWAHAGAGGRKNFQFPTLWHLVDMHECFWTTRGFHYCAVQFRVQHHTGHCTAVSWARAYKARCPHCVKWLCGAKAAAASSLAVMLDSP